MSRAQSAIEEKYMSLVEVLPQVQSLSRSDKFRVIQLLAQELAENEASPIEANCSYPIWSPDRAFDAAAIMLQALEAEKGKS